MEILKFLLENANALGVSDLLLVLLIATSIISSALLLIHWIYKHAFEKQKEVIQSQDQLIALKEQAIAEYKKKTTDLEEIKTRIEAQLSSAITSNQESEKKYGALREEFESTQEQRASLGVHCSNLTIGLLIARLISARLAFCTQLRLLIRVYVTVCNQHKDFSGPPPVLLYRKIDEAIDYYVTHLRIIRFIDHQIPPNPTYSIPKQIKDFIDNNNDEIKANETEEFLVPKILPILEKYEPEFAKRVGGSYGKKD